MSFAVTEQANSPRSPRVVMRIDDRWWRFDGLVHELRAQRAEDVRSVISQVEQSANENGLYAAGYLSYEAAAAYGLTVRLPDTEAPPCAWFGVFARLEPFDFAETAVSDYEFGEWRSALDAAAYGAGVSRVKEAIAAGHTYQANYTFPLRADFSGDPWSLFVDLARAQRARYGAFIDLGRWVICSASPELFFRLDGDVIESRPMKGTAHRGLTPESDQAQMTWLRQSEKNRAENVMIVDMIRNDLGRIAATGSVQVPQLFTVERYPTLLQMTSHVTARTSASLSAILAATFPCASITGAPKHRTMQILAELEKEPRGVYTGAIGFVAPNRRVQFNVAIRTAVVDRVQRQAVYGVGSGIVWDSEATGEYEECRLKARILATAADSRERFHLLESMRWTPEEGYFLRQRHLERLSASADYFGFPLDIGEVEKRLRLLAADLQGGCKVRLLVDEGGQVTVEARPLGQGSPPASLRVGLAVQPVSSTDVFLYHKTTRRDVYDRARASRPDCDEVLLWNEYGELTEAGAWNLVLRIGESYYSPPVSSGLLPGTLRAEMLAKGALVERVLPTTDLARAEAIILINSVRGSRQGILVSSTEPGVSPA